MGFASILRIRQVALSISNLPVKVSIGGLIEARNLPQGATALRHREVDPVVVLGMNVAVFPHLVYGFRGLVLSRAASRMAALLRICWSSA